MNGVYASVVSALVVGELMPFLKIQSNGILHFIYLALLSLVQTNAERRIVVVEGTQHETAQNNPEA